MTERVRRSPYFAKLIGNVNQPDYFVLNSSNLIIRQILPALFVVPLRTVVNNRSETALNLKINCEAKSVWNKSTNTDTV